MFARFYLRLADCRHKTILGRRPTLERSSGGLDGVHPLHEVPHGGTKCHMVWPQTLKRSIHDWRRGRLRDSSASCQHSA
jgi:hypothetical protein